MYTVRHKLNIAPIVSLKNEGSFHKYFLALFKRIDQLVTIYSYAGDSICNENPFITPSTNALGSYAICQTKDQSVAIIMVHETIFYLSKFNKLHIF